MRTIESDKGRIYQEHLWSALFCTMGSPPGSPLT